MMLKLAHVPCTCVHYVPTANTPTQEGKGQKKQTNHLKFPCGKTVPNSYQLVSYRDKRMGRRYTTMGSGRKQVYLKDQLGSG